MFVKVQWTKTNSTPLFYSQNRKKTKRLSLNFLAVLQVYYSYHHGILFRDVKWVIRHKTVHSQGPIEVILQRNYCLQIYWETHFRSREQALKNGCLWSMFIVSYKRHSVADFGGRRQAQSKRKNSSEKHKRISTSFSFYKHKG